MCASDAQIRVGTAVPLRNGVRVSAVLCWTYIIALVSAVDYIQRESTDLSASIFPARLHENGTMAVLSSLERFLLHHPLTKSHIEEAFPGCARATRDNTALNRRVESASTVAAAHVRAQADARAKRPRAPSKSVAFTLTGTVIGDGRAVPIKFAARQRVHRAPVPDPTDTPFLDSLSWRRAAPRPK